MNFYEDVPSLTAVGGVSGGGGSGNVSSVLPTSATEIAIFTDSTGNTIAGSPLLINTSGIITTTQRANVAIDMYNQFLYTNVGNVAVDWRDGRLNDFSSINSVDWVSRRLFHPNFDICIDWLNRQLYYSTPANVAFNWGSAVAYDFSSKQSFNWADRFLTDSSFATAIDWNNRRLMAGGAATSAPTVAWAAGTLNDFSSLLSIDWINRNLTDASGTVTTVQYGFRILRDQTGLQVLNWQNSNSASSAGAAIIIDNGNTSSKILSAQIGGAEFFKLDGNKSAVLGTGNLLAQNATDGYLHFTATSGTPNGIPTTYIGSVPFVVDSSTANALYFYSNNQWNILNSRVPTIGGSDSQVQYNSSGIFTGSPQFNWLQSTSALQVIGPIIQGRGTRLATSGSSAFMYIAAGSGAPQGRPPNFVGSVPLYIDATSGNSLYYFSSSGWRVPKANTSIGAAVFGGQTGQILMTSPTTALFQTSRLIFDSVNTRVGINNSTPLATLQLISSTATPIDFAIGTDSGNIGNNNTINVVIEGKNSKSTLGSPENLLFICSNDTVNSNPLGMKVTSITDPNPLNLAIGLQSIIQSNQFGGSSGTTLLLQPKLGNVGIIDPTAYAASSSIMARLDISGTAVNPTGSFYGFGTLFRTRLPSESLWQQLLTNDNGGINAHAASWIADSSGPPGTYVISVGDGSGSYLSSFFINPTSGYVGIGFSNGGGLTANYNLDVNGTAHVSSSVVLSAGITTSKGNSTIPDATYTMPTGLPGTVKTITTSGGIITGITLN